MALVELLGEKLLKNDGTEIPTSELANNEGGVVGIYFSAHWCPPCRGFTPKFAEVYKELKSAGKDFEVVFVSWDRDLLSFTGYHAEMPWLALPFESDKKEGLAKKYEVEGIPTLALINAKTGETITTEGTSILSEFGAEAFPFDEASVSKVKSEAMKKKNELLSQINDDILEHIKSAEIQDGADHACDLLKCESLALAFFKGQTCRGSVAVLAALSKACEKLESSKLGAVIVQLEEDSEFSDDMKAVISKHHVIKNDKSSELVAKIKTVVGDFDTPHVVMLKVSAKDASSANFTLIVEDAAREIYMLGHEAYPWDETAIKAYEAEKTRQREEKKKKLENFEIFEPSDGCQIVDKSGNQVATSDLGKNEVVGLYFSAHWCGPCRGFTPKLAEFYNQCKEAGKAFEVIFVSSDRKPEEFDSYYGEMPWCALRFEDRDLKGTLSEIFEVQGIPTLVLLNGKGGVISTNGRALISQGIEKFPFTE